MESIKRSYDFCRDVAKSRAKNFYYSFIVLPADRRRAMCAVYAFMRYCDDIVDGETGETGTGEDVGETGKASATGTGDEDGDAGKASATGTGDEDGDAGLADRETRLQACRALLDSAYGEDGAFGGDSAHGESQAANGTPAANRTPAANAMLPAFSDTVRRFDIPKAYFDAIIDGAEMDLTVTRYATFEDLYQYCYRVASAVGLVCIRIFGYRGEEAERYAESCGIAFQLTNILRDIREDAGMGRVYLPQEDLDAFGYPEEHIRNGLLSDSFRRLMGFQVERARSYYDEALPLLPLVQPASRACLATMIGIYRACLEEIPRRQYDVYSQRIGLSPWKKLSIVARALIRKRV